jgi:hypothetical protein
MEEEFITISNPEFNKMPFIFLELETCVLLTDWEVDTLLYRFYYLN